MSGGLDVVRKDFDGCELGEHRSAYKATQDTPNTDYAPAVLLLPRLA